MKVTSIALVTLTLALAGCATTGSDRVFSSVSLADRANVQSEIRSAPAPHQYSLDSTSPDWPYSNE